jgi:hypothetical protein
MEFYGEIKLKGALADGTGDPLLTKDATSDEVGTAANALGTLTSANIFVGNASNVPTGVAVTGDISVDNAGVTAIATGVIVNADIYASAAIAVSKLAALTASRAIVSDGSGFLSVSAVTSTELGYVSGVTSAIQTQLNAKQATITGGATTITSSDLTANRALISSGTGKVAVSSVTATELGYVSGVTSAIQTQLNTKLAPTITSVAEGDILYYNGSAWVNLARGTDGQTLRSSATTILWDTPTINGIPIGGTDGQVLAKQSGTDFDADWETLVVASITDLTASAAELNVLDGITATVTELNYVDGVSSNIQTQLDGKLSTSLPQNAIFVGNSSNVATSLSGGTNGYVLTSVSGVPTWAAVSAGTPPGADTQMIFNDAGSFGVDTGFVYNKTTNTLTVVNLDTATTIGSAAIYRVSGTDVSVADGGTGLSAIAALSILVANSANTYVALTPGAGNSLRVNAGGTAWEAYTPVVDALQTATVTLSAAEILDLNATPKQIIAAPGANKVISVHRAFLIYTFVTSAYATNTTLRIVWNGVNVTPVGYTGLLAVTESRQYTSVGNTLAGAIDASNKALMVDVQTGNPTGGDSTIKIIVEYSIIDI